MWYVFYHRRYSIERKIKNFFTIEIQFIQVSYKHYIFRVIKIRKFIINITNRGPIDIEIWKLILIMIKK